ncbi:MAG: membrane dipeptidase [Ignavibacteriales bacterium]|nr:MAG: membrane dipeptidase [Ignavibacteriales bacterium]
MKINSAAKNITLLLLISLSFIACLKEMKEPERKIEIAALSDDELQLKADSLAKNILIVDTHIDVPYRLNNKWEDISKRTNDGEFDYPRAMRGGLNAAFMSIYVPSNLEGTGRAKKLAEQLISDVEEIVKKNPDKFGMVYSSAEVTNQLNKIISLPLGMENGSPIEGKLSNLKYFYDKGIRYITLAHAKSNHICDSSYDPDRKWNGLSPFGEKVIKEMNRLGIMIDVSHITDSAFFDVINITKTPVIASHSSCRYFTPGYERNISDEMIKVLAENEGVIQINFGSSFLKEEIFKKTSENTSYINQFIKENNYTREEARRFRREYIKENHPGYADVKDVVNHINHVVKLVGIDHVGIGSDFDGLGDSLPDGLKDVSKYPNLIYELLKEGYSDEDIKKICSGNILRVWGDVEQYAGDLNKTK